MSDYSRAEVVKICKDIKDLATREAEGCEVKEYDFEGVVRKGMCKGVIEEIGSWFQGGWTVDRGYTTPCRLCGERLAADMCYDRGNQFFKEDDMDAQIILQNMDKVEEWINDISFGSEMEALLKGDYSLADIVFNIVSYEMDSCEYLGLSEHDEFYNNHCLSVGGACAILDELGFSDYEDYGITWRDVQGYDENGYDENGFDDCGYDEEGYDENGFDNCGYNEEGYDENGFDEEGYDENGFDAFGYDKAGYDEAEDELER